MRILDVIQSIPGTLLTITVATVFGSGFGNTILALAISHIPGSARSTRALVLSVRKNEYLEAAEKEWAFIRDHVIDKRPGSEWFWEVDPEGNPYPDRPIVEPWKCPYHNGRMCMEVLQRIPE